MEFKKIKPKSFKMDSVGSSNKKYYPTISFNLKDLPEVKNWEVGNKYKVALELKQTGLNINEYENSASFEIIGIKVMDGMPKLVMEKKKDNSKRDIIKKYS